MKTLRFIVMLFSVVLLGIGVAHAAESYKVLTGLELKAMQDRHEPGLVIIDTRPAPEYREGHIKGAVNIPLNVMASNPASMQYPLTQMIVFYCNGFT